MIRIIGRARNFFHGRWKDRIAKFIYVDFPPKYESNLSIAAKLELNFKNTTKRQITKDKKN